VVDDVTEQLVWEEGKLWVQHESEEIYNVRG
jgi:hypothetical protein